MYNYKKLVQNKNKNGMEVFIMKIINWIALTLVIIGAINWLLVGIFEFNLVDTIFGSLSVLSRIIYIIVGIAGLWSIAFYSKLADKLGRCSYLPNFYKFVIWADIEIRSYILRAILIVCLNSYYHFCSLWFIWHYLYIPAM